MGKLLREPLHPLIGRRQPFAHRRDGRDSIGGAGRDRGLRAPNGRDIVTHLDNEGAEFPVGLVEGILHRLNLPLEKHDLCLQLFKLNRHPVDLLSLILTLSDGLSGTGQEYRNNQQTGQIVFLHNSSFCARRPLEARPKPEAFQGDQSLVCQTGNLRRRVKSPSPVFRLLSLATPDIDQFSATIVSP